MLKSTSKLVYVGSPYTHHDLAVQRRRAEAAACATAALQIHFPTSTFYSPIAHGHALAKYMTPDQAGDHGMWMRHCKRILDDAEVFVWLPLEGWSGSSGLNWEFNRCRELDIPILWVCPTLPAELGSYSLRGLREADHLWMA